MCSFSLVCRNSSSGVTFSFCGRGMGNEGCDESVNIFAFIGTLFICSSLEHPFFCLLDVIFFLSLSLTFSFITFFLQPLTSFFFFFSTYFFIPLFLSTTSTPPSLFLSSLPDSFFLSFSRKSFRSSIRFSWLYLFILVFLLFVFSILSFFLF
ncbi:unnamed protein product [Acanthosepion pharaonis]|uniref:Uncharacterized protein n=1 Tax=Acanthosepion pharaonis TaxID=158019 RepID=A0A812AMB8_ACAPH|nr:unnamed protein product [Sepia pharaonis]